MKPHEFNLQYEEARREDRKLLGSDAEIQRDTPRGPLVAAINAVTGPVFTHRVGVNSGGRFIIVGAGDSFRAALEDAKSRQR